MEVTTIANGRQESIDLIETALERIRAVLEWTSEVDQQHDATNERVSALYTRVDNIEERLHKFEEAQD